MHTDGTGLDMKTLERLAQIENECKGKDTPKAICKKCPFSSKDAPCILNYDTEEIKAVLYFTASIVEITDAEVAKETKLRHMAVDSLLDVMTCALVMLAKAKKAILEPKGQALIPRVKRLENLRKADIILNNAQRDKTLKQDEVETLQSVIDDAASAGIYYDEALKAIKWAERVLRFPQLKYRGGHGLAEQNGLVKTALEVDADLPDESALLFDGDESLV